MTKPKQVVLCQLLANKPIDAAIRTTAARELLTAGLAAALVRVSLDDDVARQVAG